MRGVKGNCLTGRYIMDALNMTMLFDYYGDMLTERQKQCFDLRYNQDMSLSEIAEELQVSRQGVNDNLRRAEALLLEMERKTGFIARDMEFRKISGKIRSMAQELCKHNDSGVSEIGGQIELLARRLEE